MTVPPDVASLGWSDIELEGISWQESGRDVVFHTREPSAVSPTGIRRTMTCRWAESLELSIRTREGHGGHPFTWDGAIEELPDGRLSVFLDFASSGHVRLVCAEIDVEVADRCSEC